MPADERKSTTTAADWQRRYEEADTPWDSGLVDEALRATTNELRASAAAGGSGPRKKAVEFGCGTGTNAVYLAQAGYDVTAIDLSALAIEKARARATATGVEVDWRVGDLASLEASVGPFDFLFDRGCYHCTRRAGQLAGYLKAVERLVRPGGRLLVLAGNADSAEPGGPPKVTAAEIIGDFERLCRIEKLTAYSFQEADGSAGPLAWALWMTRR